MDQSIGVKTKLISVTAITSTGDGTIYLADEGSLRLYSLMPYMPHVDDRLEIKIHSPESGEMYIFNNHGQHIATRSTTTGRLLYSFFYSQESSFGKLTDIADSSGNKISLIRDSSGALHTLEISSGIKCQTFVNKLGLLERISSSPNNTVHFDYYSNGLIRSKMYSSTGQLYFYLYDSNGRLIEYIQPTGSFIYLKSHYKPFEESFQAIQIGVFSNDDLSDQFIQKIVLNRTYGLKMHFENKEYEADIQLITNGSMIVNTSFNTNAIFTEKPSKVSEEMLNAQSQMFPVISHSYIERTFLREPNQSLHLVIDYGLKTKSSVISAVEKFVAVNNSLALKIEFDWNSNRQIYYNQTQRPILFVQYDDKGRPIQWVPNQKDRWSSQSISYDKFGNIASWQDGTLSLNYVRDRIGRLVEVRQSDHSIKYFYSASDVDQTNLLQLPSSVSLQSGHKYNFDLDEHGKLQAIVTPKGTKYELNLKVIFGFYKFSFCPPFVESNLHNSSSSRCYMWYFNEYSQPIIQVLPYDSGKVVHRYRSRVSNSKSFSKDVYRFNDDNLLIDQVFHGNGLVERWFDAKSGRDLKGLWCNDDVEYGITYKYTRNSGLLKHQSYLFSNIRSVSQLTFNYKYDIHFRLRSIQTKLGSINLPTLEFSYSANGQLETIGSFRYFERSQNESLIGDGVALFVRRYDSTKRQIRHASLAIADKEVFRVDYNFNQLGMLMQTRIFMRHLGANKIRLQNFTYDNDGQLIEVQGREQWRFMYDFNGNLVTFLYLGNRIDIEYDSADRIKNFGKGQHNSAQSGTSPYVTDSRGFVVKRGEERLTYNNLGQLISVSRPNRYELNNVYDHKNRLVIRRDHQNNVTQFFYGNPQKPNLVTHSFNNADGRVLSLIYDDFDDTLIMLRVNNENFYVACDQTKSPLLVLDHRGQVIKELHRSPYGHILFDSNPTFYLPVDFQGGILDPLTNLIQFSNGRVYDTLTGLWLTPNVDSVLKQNLFEYPKVIYTYHFAQNNPVNFVEPTSLENRIVSMKQVSEILQNLTSHLVSQDGNHKKMSLFSHFLPRSLFFPVKSTFISSLKSIVDQLQKFYIFPGHHSSKVLE